MSGTGGQPRVQVDLNILAKVRKKNLCAEDLPSTPFHGTIPTPYTRESGRAARVGLPSCTFGRGARDAPKRPRVHTNRSTSCSNQVGCVQQRQRAPRLILHCQWNLPAYTLLRRDPSARFMKLRGACGSCSTHAKGQRD